MRIGLDARHARTGLGIATFVSSLAQALVDGGHAEVIWLGSVDVAPAGIEAVDPVGGPYPLTDGPIGRRRLRKLGLDLVHMTGNTGWRQPGPVPTVLTVHDLIFLESESHRSLRQRVGHAYSRLNVTGAIPAADALTTGSETTANLIERRFGRRATVIPYGVPFPDRLSAPAPDAYLVAFGGRDPRKGVPLAVEVSRATGLPLHIVARAGLPEGFVHDAAPELSSGQISTHATMDRAELDELIGGALALLYLSRDEGFGLPVIEAMAIGTPVITGNAPATREVARDAGLLVDLDAVVASAVAHVEALRQPGARAGVVARGRAVAGRHSWSAAAEHYAAVYSGVLK